MSNNIAPQLYRLTGKDNFREALIFMQSRPLLRKVFERDMADPGDTIEFWIAIYDHDMTDEQREEAGTLMLVAKHKVEREHAQSYYY